MQNSSRLVLVRWCASILMISPAAWSASPVIVDANGQVVAFYVGSNPSRYAVAVSKQGFMMAIRMETGEISSCPGDPARPGCSGYSSGIYYLGPNCSGGTLVRHYIDGPAPRGGLVFHFEGDGLLWTVGKNPMLSSSTPASVRSSDGTCSNTIEDWPGYGFVDVTLNDPALTGVPNSPLPAPMRIEVATINESSGLVSRDGFEAAT